MMGLILQQPRLRMPTHNRQVKQHMMYCVPLMELLKMTIEYVQHHVKKKPRYRQVEPLRRNGLQKSPQTFLPTV